MAASIRAHSVSVAGAVIDDSGHVLVIQRADNGHWELPGGVLELGETFEDGVVREVLEETGITVSVERLSGVYKNLDQGIVALVYRCHPIDGETATTEESRDTRWIDPSVLNEIMDEPYAIRLLDAFDREPASRAHDGRRLLLP